MGYKMPFGKYRGRELSSLPRDYLEWLADDERELREPLKTNVTKLLDGDYDLEDEPAAPARRYGAPQTPKVPPIQSTNVIKVDLGNGMEAVGSEAAVTAHVLASISRALWAILDEMRTARHEADTTDAPDVDAGSP